MSELGINLRCGIGDILCSWAALEKVKHNYEKIYIDAQLELISIFRNDSELYRKFVIDFIKLLFSNDSKYILFENKGKQDPFYLLKEGTIPYTFTYCPLLFGKETKNKIDGEYIIITTKVRYLNTNFYSLFKDRFVENIKSLSKKYKIVLIGERDIDNNREYREEGHDNIYTIYKDICNIENIIDLSEPVYMSSDNSNPPNLDKIMEDCDLMRKAKCVITLGCGGNLALAAATSTVIGLRHDGMEYFDPFILGRPKVNIVFNIEEFFSLLGLFSTTN